MKKWDQRGRDDQKQPEEHGPVTSRGEDGKGWKSAVSGLHQHGTEELQSDFSAMRWRQKQFLPKISSFFAFQNSPGQSKGRRTWPPQSCSCFAARPCQGCHCAGKMK